MPNKKSKIKQKKAGLKEQLLSEVLNMDESRLVVTLQDAICFIVDTMGEKGLDAWIEYLKHESLGDR